MKFEHVPSPALRKGGFCFVISPPPYFRASKSFICDSAPRAKIV